MWKTPFCFLLLSVIIKSTTQKSGLCKGVPSAPSEARQLSVLLSVPKCTGCVLVWGVGCVLCCYICQSVTVNATAVCSSGVCAIFFLFFGWGGVGSVESLVKLLSVCLKIYIVIIKINGRGDRKLFIYNLCFIISRFLQFSGVWVRPYIIEEERFWGRDGRVNVQI